MSYIGQETVKSTRNIYFNSKIKIFIIATTTVTLKTFDIIISENPFFSIFFFNNIISIFTQIR